MSILYEKDVWNKSDVHSLENIEGFTIFGDGKEPPSDTTTDNTTSNVSSIFSSDDKTDDTSKDTTENKKSESTKHKIGAFFSSDETKTDDTPKEGNKLESVLPETPVNNRDAKKFIVRMVEMFIGFLVGIVTVAYILFTSTDSSLYAKTSDDGKPSDDTSKTTPDQTTDDLIKEGFAAIFRENAEHTFDFCMELAQYLSSKVDKTLNAPKNRFDLLYVFMTFIVLMMMIANPAILAIGYMAGFSLILIAYSIIASFTFDAGLLKYVFPTIGKLLKDVISYITDPKHWKVLLITIVVFFFFGALFFGLTSFIPTIFRYIGIFLIGVLMLGLILTMLFTTFYMFYFVFTVFANKNMWDLAKKIFMESRKLILILTMYGIGYNMLSYLSGYSIPTGLFQLSIGTFLAYFLFGLATLLGGSFMYEYAKDDKNITESYYSIYTIISIAFGYLMAGFW
jgi:hypothetical protein